MVTFQQVTQGLQIINEYHHGLRIDNSDQLLCRNMILRHWRVQMFCPLGQSLEGRAVASSKEEEGAVLLGDPHDV